MLVFALAACSQTGIIPGGNLVEDPEDLEAPIVRTVPVDEPQAYGGDIIIDAIVKDPSDVFMVELVYRPETETTWYRKSMGIVGGDSTNGYQVQATIKGGDVRSGGLYYYVEAIDASNNANVGCSPITCDEDPYHISIVAP
jgi:hypothetical protein